MKTIYDAETGRIKEYVFEGKVYDAETGQIKEYLDGDIVYDSNGRIKEFADGNIVYNAENCSMKEFVDGNIRYSAVNGRMTEFTFDTENISDTEDLFDADKYKNYSVNNRRKSSNKFFDNNGVKVTFWIVEILLLMCPLGALLECQFVEFFKVLFTIIPFCIAVFFIFMFIDQKVTDFWNGI